MKKRVGAKLNKGEREEAGEGKSGRVKDKGEGGGLFAPHIPVMIRQQPQPYYSTYPIALRTLEKTFTKRKKRKDLLKLKTTNKKLIIPLGPQLYFH